MLGLADAVANTSMDGSRRKSWQSLPALALVIESASYRFLLMLPFQRRTPAGKHRGSYHKPKVTRCRCPQVESGQGK